MNILERLKELNATTGKRNGDEDLGHWADREKRENMWVRDVALPLLLEVVEAAREWHKAKMVLRQSDVDTNAQAATDYYLASDRLSAALAKLEKEG